MQINHPSHGTPPGDDPTVAAGPGITPTRYFENHGVTYTVQTKSTDYTLAVDGSGYVTDDVIRCSGTFNLTIPAAMGTGKQVMVIMDSGAVAVTIVRSGSDTIGLTTGFTCSVPGDAFILTDEASGAWGLCGARGTSATNITPGALALAGTSPLAARTDHTHCGPGAIAAVTGEVSVSNTTTETTILTATLPTGLLTSTTVFRFKFRGTVQLQATSGTLTFRMYVGANAGQTVQLASVTSAQARVGCEFEGEAGMRTSGASGTFITTGKFELFTSATAMRNAIQGAETTTTVDTTASTPVVKLTAQFATQSATNILRVQNGMIEIVNL